VVDYKSDGSANSPTVSGFGLVDAFRHKGDVYVDAADLGPIDAPAQTPPVEPDPAMRPPELMVDRVIAYGLTLEGTPYCFGAKRPGETSSYGCTGIDCSGFVCEVLEHCGVYLGNRYYLSAEAIRQIAREVDRGDIKRGDLVFFHTTYGTSGPNYATHIGFYSGPDELLNANSHGVVRTDLNNQYWQDHWLSVGRVLSG